MALLDRPCWLVLRNWENYINLSIVGHLCALIDAVPVFVGHKAEITRTDFVCHHSPVADYLYFIIVNICIVMIQKFSLNNTNNTYQRHVLETGLKNTI